MRLEHHSAQSGLDGIFFLHTPQPQHRPPRERTMPEPEGKQRQHGAADERADPCFGSPDRRKANCAEKCHETVKEWSEFKPSRSRG